MVERDDRRTLDIRAEAANLVLRFRDGEITNDELEDSFYPLCRRTQDRALRAIGTAIWCTYSDLRERTLPAPEPQVRALFDRCILFLRSDLSYEWERDNFIGIAGVSTILRWLFKTGKRLLGRRPERFGLNSGPDSEADWVIWPFQNDQDHRRVKAELAARNN